MKVDCPSVLLIYTGGTIGMIENPETGALENFNFDQLLQHVPELKRFNYRISSYQFDPPIDSSDMEPSLWAKIVKIINYNYDNFDGFVILHGTIGIATTVLTLIGLELLSYIFKSVGMKSSMISFSTNNKDTLKQIADRFNSKDYMIVSYEMETQHSGEMESYQVTMVIKSKRNNDEGHLLSLMQKFPDVTVQRIE